MKKIIFYHMQYIYTFLFILLLVLGCASKKNSPSPAPVPDWFLSTQSDELTFYGKGSDDRSQDKAIKIALNDIASQLSVSIHSTTQSSQKVVRTGNDSTSVSDDSVNIRAKVEALNFKGYSTEKHVFSGGVHYVLVAVDKTKFLKTQKNNLKILDNEINLNYQTIKDGSLIQAIKSAQTFKSQIQKAGSLAAIISSIDDQFDLVHSQSSYDQLTKNIQRETSEFSIYITPGSPPEVEVILSRQMNQEQISLVKNRNAFRKNTHIIEMSMIEENHIAFDEYMTKLQITLSLKEQPGNIVATNSFEAKGSSLSNFQKAKQKAIRQFTKKVNDMNFLQVLGIL